MAAFVSNSIPSWCRDWLEMGLTLFCTLVELQVYFELVVGLCC
ncbi:hypothetical protein M6B38_395945 [Iris pallida]|uniref:Uncharacterized protein n=1 Tax=Iris pallida TaxID=29817 RepID=A0AAX6FWC1_IRIPA|nr:hypothetical protein M6B38_163595 [Iris pallida]KAJ6820236.1 hypothetical protein M6B38_398145 [Iris pallida]KAJ6820684.1 hypothetical protein M6B38_395945 [Iris pallida]